VIVAIRTYDAEMRAKKGDAAVIPRIQTVGKIAMVFGLLAMIFAVLTFN